MGSTSGDILHGLWWTTLNGPMDSAFVLGCSTWISLMQRWIEPYISLDRNMQRWSQNSNLVKANVSSWRGNNDDYWCVLPSETYCYILRIQNFSHYFCPWISFQSRSIQEINQLGCSCTLINNHMIASTCIMYKSRRQIKLRFFCYSKFNSSLFRKSPSQRSYFFPLNYTNQWGMQVWCIIFWEFAVDWNV